MYRLGADGKVTLLVKDMTAPNGIGLSPDARTLYVANSDPKRAIWMAYPVKGDGSVGEGRLFFDATAEVGEARPGLPDGLKVDAAGNLFATGPGGVHVFGPAGERLGTIETGVPTANCAFGRRRPHPLHHGQHGPPAGEDPHQGPGILGRGAPVGGPGGGPPRGGRKPGPP